VKKKSAVSLVIGAAAVLLSATPASAAVTVADWQMNERSGSSTMQSTAGSYSTSIGSDVVLTGSSYKFPYIKPNSAYRPAHIVTAQNAPALNPGTDTWSVTTRFRFTNAFGNMLQKGQAGSGNYFKMQAPHGNVSCLFRGASGSVSVSAGTALNDGAWHVVRCERAGTSVTMTIDGSKVRRGSGETGNIANTLPFAIGGKSKCNADTVSCDYWVGEMDYVRIQRG